MVEETFEEICSNIRACLNSSKRQTTVRELNKDYESVLGSSIPFKKLGYRTIEEFIKTVPNLKFTRIGSELFIDVKPDEKTIHITNLVRGQKCEKKKSKSYWKSVYCPPPLPRRTYVPVHDSRSNHPRPQVQLQYKCNTREDKYSSAKSKVSRPISSKTHEIDHNGISGRQHYHSERNFFHSRPYKESVDDVLNKFDNLSVTLDCDGNAIKSRGTKGFRSHWSRSACQEDHGYSSMNEKSSLNLDSPFEKRSSAKEHRSLSPETLVHPRSTPAAIMEAARAWKVNAPNDISDVYVELMEPAVNRDVERVPFQSVNIEDENTLKDNIDFLKYNPNVFSEKLKTSPRSTEKSLTDDLQPRSKMTEVEIFKPGSDINPPLTEGTFCHKLFLFTAEYNLPCPEFHNFHKYEPKLKLTTYFSKVKIGDDLVYSSMPFESTELKEVHEYLAKVVLEDLKNRHERRSDEVKLSITNDIQQIVTRIAEIVSKHVTGLKCEAVESQYKSDYKEILPVNWLDIVKDLSLLSVENLYGGTYVYPPVDSRTNSDVTKLPSLVLPETDLWPVFITYCLSTNCVYFRIINEEDIFEILSNEMETQYGSNIDLQSLDVIKEGSYYAAFLGGNWFRVKALSGGVDQNIKVVLIDIGETDEVLKGHLYHLDESLTVYPSQAMRCGLSNLEQYHTNEYVTHVLFDEIVGRSLYAQIDSRSPHLQLTLFDTSEADDININNNIIQKIEKDLSPPKIPVKNLLTDIYLTSVQEDGSAFVQIISSALNCLNIFLSEANQILKKNPEKYTIESVSGLVGEKVFLVKYDDDELWHRATINSLRNNEQVEVTFIDYGNVEIVSLSHMADVKQFAPQLAAIPPQSIKVQLVKPTVELFTKRVIEFIMALAQRTEDEQSNLKMFIMKALNNDPVPDVELFLRSPDDHSLMSLNDIIGSCFPHYQGPNFQEVKLSLANTLRQKTIENPLGEDKRKPDNECLVEKFKTVVPLKIPQNCNQMMVYVTLVFNPSHFIVQPWEYREQFLKMTEDMKEYYTSNHKPEVDISLIRNGETFAFKKTLNNGTWCRCVITQLMQSTNSVSIKCLDYGDSLSVNYSDLFVLLPCFRELPALAIRSELAGIVPLHTDWNMSDCIRFKEIVSQRSFIGAPVNVSEDSVSFILIDTKKGMEIDIGAMLVEEGRAKDVTRRVRI